MTPFMGVGSEVFGAVVNGRRGIGIELKDSYYRQAAKNLRSVETGLPPTEQGLLGIDLFRAPEAEAAE